jgi:hypothetical protein
VAEEVRQLRTSLQYVQVDRPVQVIAVVSAEAAEGKSTVAINLALAFTEAGRRTLLIDADLRTPRIAECLGLDGAVGLPEPGGGFGAALAPVLARFFVVVAWPVVSIRCVPRTPWVALGEVALPAIGPDGALGLPDCWAVAVVTPPTSVAVASRHASVLIVSSLLNFQIG